MQYAVRFPSLPIASEAVAGSPISRNEASIALASRSLACGLAVVYPRTSQRDLARSLIVIESFSVM